MSDPASNPPRQRLNAALDRELDAENALAFERELAANPALAAEYRELEAVRDGVRRHVPREPAPDALVGRVLALAAEPTADVVPLAPHAWGLARRLPLAASLAALGFAAGVALMSLGGPGASQSVASSLVSEFARAAVAGQPFDVASSDRHTVKPWLAGRATVSADIVDLAPQGFPLAGGRIAIVDSVPAPTLVYRHNEHLVAVTELPLRLAGARSASGVETVDGFHVVRWSDANLGYVAVSDMDEQTLAEFVAAFREAGKRGAEKTD
jgi:anti-sigma factor RsiW